MFRRLETLATESYELEPREDHPITFCSDDEGLQHVIDSFGVIDASYAHFSTSTVEGTGLQEACLDQAAYFTVVPR